MRFALYAASFGILSLSTLQAASPPASENVDRMDWWREAKFGLFIHWGPVSLKGTEIGWSRGGERRGRQGRGQVPVEEYDNLYNSFNPVKFDAFQWVATAKAAGMKYLVFTTKHHDGFSMFDSRHTNYTITHSPFKRDVVAELARACHESGLKQGDEWKTFHAGTTIGAGLRLSFAPITARFIRLSIREATDGPTFWEFQIFAPKKT